MSGTKSAELKEWWQMTKPEREAKKVLCLDNDDCVDVNDQQDTELITEKATKKRATEMWLFFNDFFIGELIVNILVDKPANHCPFLPNHCNGVTTC